MISTRSVRRATWPRSHVARRWPRACDEDRGAVSCSWAGTTRSAAPAPPTACPSASLLLSQEEQNVCNQNQFKREQAVALPWHFGGNGLAGKRFRPWCRGWERGHGRDGRGLAGGGGGMGLGGSWGGGPPHA